MEEALKIYIQFVEKFEQELTSKYKIPDNFWNKSNANFPKKGSTDSFKYSFHGAGCRVEKKGIVCEYDIAPLNENHIKFSPWKFFNFIETNPDLKKLSREDFELGLSILEKKRKISKVFIEGIETGVYQIHQ
ncbi:hypothetical protein M0D21_16955 [Aquimarina sp. D1M17]|uniref:DUF6896 domain-containing protein n=1 Tax=Aquimarina acroporae TaxID=2937283 RepID=UPI0020C175D2|nr:hypothetical protein [Aquimarina acroporae]MCK8523272.1 hypothetical protein [Aquimarina acroporae]